MTLPATTAFYVGAAMAEIAGCFAFWAWLRLGKSVLWVVPGLVSLAVFAVLLTRVEPPQPVAPSRLTEASTSPPRSSGFGWPRGPVRIGGT